MKLLLFCLGIILIISATAYFYRNNIKENILKSTTISIAIPANKNTRDQNNNLQNQERITEIASGLDTPWALDFLPNGNILVTERRGTIRIIENGILNPNPVGIIQNSKEIGEGGLLGIALHPEFESNNYVFVYYTYNSDGGNTLNRVSRFNFENGNFINEQLILDKIPGAPNHNGGRIRFGPDNFLYVTTGDAQDPSLSQDRTSLAGKILRITDEGRPADGNPFGTSIFSLGHRNPQGLAWDDSGNLWSTEHGPSGGNLGTGNDELNSIKSGQNYGWPEIQGNQKRNNMITPIINSGPSKAWAPGGTAYLNGSIFFTGLRGKTLYEYKISEKKLIEHLKDEYGRLREAIVGPDNMLYVTTSNRDGRGIPGLNDDKVIRINPNRL